MRILVAPDKFKGSLTALQACEAIREGIHRAKPDYEVTTLAFADGGEGTCDLLTRLSAGRKVSMRVLNPAFKAIECEYGISKDGSTAFIEMARASGLQLLAPGERNPMNTTTIGTGQLIADALNKGVARIILGVGGSATNDGGIGMASSLGFEFLSANGEKLLPVGKSLRRIASITERNIHPRLRSVAFSVIFDVRNPLVGPDGAAHVFARQKGASASDIELLDEGLRNLAAVIGKQFHIHIDFPGAGAGGGLGGGARLFLNAAFQPGIDFIIHYAHLDEHVRSCDLVITGEGKMDNQTLSGKVVMGIARVAAQHGKMCVAFCGSSELDADQVKNIGLSEVIELRDTAHSEEVAIRDAYSLLAAKAERWISKQAGSQI